VEITRIVFFKIQKEFSKYLDILGLESHFGPCTGNNFSTLQFYPAAILSTSLNIK
jgi:hypothetical protein